MKLRSSLQFWHDNREVNAVEIKERKKKKGEETIC